MDFIHQVIDNGPFPLVKPNRKLSDSFSEVTGLLTHSLLVHNYLSDKTIKIETLVYDDRGKTVRLLPTDLQCLTPKVFDIHSVLTDFASRTTRVIFQIKLKDLYTCTDSQLKGLKIDLSPEMKHKSSLTGDYDLINYGIENLYTKLSIQAKAEAALQLPKLRRQVYREGDKFLNTSNLELIFGNRTFHEPAPDLAEFPFRQSVLDRVKPNQPYTSVSFYYVGKWIHTPFVFKREDHPPITTKERNIIDELILETKKQIRTTSFKVSKPRVTSTVSSRTKYTDEMIKAINEKKAKKEAIILHSKFKETKEKFNLKAMKANSKLKTR